MTDEIKSAVAQALQENMSGNNMSPEAFANRRLKQLQPEVSEAQEPQETEEEVIDTVQEEVPEEPVQEPEAVESEEADTTESTDEVLSQYNLDEMSEQDLKELAEKLGSRAVARFGELTAKRKQAEEELMRIKQSMQQTNPLTVKESIKDNPYSNLNTIEELQEKAEEINNIVEWAEDTLFNSDGYGPDDVVTEVEGKEVTKAEVRNALKNARKGKAKYLPDQLNKINNIAQSKEVKSQFQQKATEELPWLSGEDNDVRQRYEAMINDKRFQDLENEVSPDISAQLPYIIAHAANSIYGRRTIEDTKSGVKLNPPSTGANSAPSSNRAKKGAKALADLNSRFKESGDKNDFIKLRTLQLTK